MLWHYTYACHILLERPSMFDRKVMHDGHSDSYTFSKDGERATIRFKLSLTLAK